MLNTNYHNIQSVRGMHDYLPQDVVVWQNVENVLKATLNSYGYDEIRFPIVECYELFKRSIGEVTDVVEKEMYTFDDHHGNNLALRPEGTSGCVRAGIKNSLFHHKTQRLWYMGPMFRKERPQKGRYRQFHQFGAESFGYIGPDIDAELILITARCWKKLGISKHVVLELNSIGSFSDRKIYREKLIHFLEKNKHKLDDTSIRRLYSNPLRILDTKNDEIKKILETAPVLGDCLDEFSRAHFSKLCKLLDLFGLSYTINPRLVRGLDYYNRTVFEWVTNNLGAKRAVCAGGRYDDLVKQLRGGVRSVPAVGFSIGLERVLLLIKTINDKRSGIFDNILCVDVYLISIGYRSQKYVMLLSEHIRDQLPFLRVVLNYEGVNLKQQLSRANKKKSRIVLIAQDQNVFEDTIILKDLKSGFQEILEYANIVKKLTEIFETVI